MFLRRYTEYFFIFFFVTLKRFLFKVFMSYDAMTKFVLGAYNIKELLLHIYYFIRSVIYMIVLSTPLRSSSLGL